MDDGIEGVVGHAILQQILQSVAGEDAPTVIHDGQSDIQVGIVTEHVLHDVILELVVQEFRGVGLKVDIGAVLVLGRLRDIADQLAALEDSLAHLAVTVTAHLEMAAESVDGFHADTIQTNTLLESLRVELTAGV